MKRGSLSQYFTGVAAKRLKPVEINPNTSNQHEFNGVNDLRRILGQGSGERVKIQTRFLYLNDDDEPTEPVDSYVTWYDARRNDSNRSAEYRLYYPSSHVMKSAKTGDLLVVAGRRDGSLLVIIAESGSTAENQVRYLFGLHGDGAKYEIRDKSDTDQTEVGFVGKLILEHIGIEVDDTDEDILERMLHLFKGGFPTTHVFSKFARETVPDISPFDSPDSALIAWMDREEVLFRTLERHIVAERIKRGFGSQGDDVDEFIRFSLSVHNRRKARVGFALENHIEAVFHQLSIRHSRSKVTENRSRPDFIFPGIGEYMNPEFDASMLTVLGVKSTCKDRWRQVLAEADRISRKHLFTLEPGISENQTNEMMAKDLLLIIPEGLHETYTPTQRSWLMSFNGFINLVRNRQDSG